jgi:hypothetical protein
VSELAMYAEECNYFLRYAAWAEANGGEDEPAAPYVKTAIFYAEERGWKVFPARMEGGKKYSYLSAAFAPGGENWGMTNDPEQLRENFTEPKWQHECGVGIPTGEVNGIFVVEADTVKGHGVDGLKSLAALEAKHGKLPLTLMAESPSGSVHRYYKHPGVKVWSSASVIALGVDVKGDGGMVIAPPSKRADGAYGWLNDLPIADAPEWLVQRVTQQPSASSDGEERNAFTATGEQQIIREPNDVEELLATLEYGRNIHSNITKVLSSLLSRGEPPVDEAIEAIINKVFALPAARKWNRAKERSELRESAITWFVKTPDVFKLQPESLPEWLTKDKRIKKLLAEGHGPAGDVPEAKGKEQKTENKQSSAIVIVRAADVTVRQKEWLWEGHLLRGGLELLTGLPGLGKSQLQIYLMACATAGLPWPDGALASEPVNVIMVTAEDAIDTEVVPRLMAAEADLKRIHILKCIKADKLQRQFLLAEDLVRLEQVIAQVGNVGLICIDPITAYMGGKTDSHKATEVRSQLGPLKDFSERTNVAVSAITHPAKNAGAKAIDYFIGSQAFIAAARVGHACFEEIEVDEDGEKNPTGRILFTNVKHNAHRKMPTLAFRIESHFIYPEPFLPIESSCVVWEKEAVTISADQAMAAARGGAKAKSEEASSEIVEFLRMMLDAGGGSCKQTDIAEQAEALGYSDKEMRTARKKAHIVSKKEGFDGPWMWTWEGGKRPD